MSKIGREDYGLNESNKSNESSEVMKSNVNLTAYLNNEVQLVGFVLPNENLGFYVDVEDHTKTYVNYNKTITKSVLDGRQLQIKLHVDNLNTDQTGLIIKNDKNSIRLNADVKMELGYGLSIGRTDVNINHSNTTLTDNVTDNLGISYDLYDGTSGGRVTDQLLSNGFYLEYDNVFNENIEVFVAANEANNALLKVRTNVVNNDDVKVNACLSGVLYTYTNNKDENNAVIEGNDNTDNSRQLQYVQVSADGTLNFANFNWYVNFGIGSTLNESTELSNEVTGYEVKVDMSDKLPGLENVAFNLHGKLFNSFNYNQAHNVANEDNNNGFVEGISAGLEVLYKINMFDIGLSVDYLTSNAKAITGTQDADIDGDPDILTLGGSIHSKLLTAQYFRRVLAGIDEDIVNLSLNL